MSVLIINQINHCLSVVLTLSGSFRRNSLEQRDICILPSDAAVQTVKCGLVLLSVLHVVHITSSSFVLSALLVVRIIFAAVEVYLVTTQVLYCLYLRCSFHSEQQLVGYSPDMGPTTVVRCCCTDSTVSSSVVCFARCPHLSRPPHHFTAAAVYLSLIHI